MKKQSGRQRETSTSLPLEGGGEGGGNISQKNLLQRLGKLSNEGRRKR